MVCSSLSRTRCKLAVLGKDTAGPGEILVSRTIRDLVAGARAATTPRRRVETTQITAG